MKQVILYPKNTAQELFIIGMRNALELRMASSSRTSVASQVYQDGFALEKIINAEALADSEYTLMIDDINVLKFFNALKPEVRKHCKAVWLGPDTPTDSDSKTLYDGLSVCMLLKAPTAPLPSSVTYVERPLISAFEHVKVKEETEVLVTPKQVYIGICLPEDDKDGAYRFNEKEAETLVSSLIAALKKQGLLNEQLRLVISGGQNTGYYNNEGEVACSDGSKVYQDYITMHFLEKLVKSLSDEGCSHEGIITSLSRVEGKVLTSELCIQMYLNAGMLILPQSSSDVDSLVTTMLWAQPDMQVCTVTDSTLSKWAPKTGESVLIEKLLSQMADKAYEALRHKSLLDRSLSTLKKHCPSGRTLLWAGAAAVALAVVGKSAHSLMSGRGSVRPPTN